MVSRCLLMTQRYNSQRISSFTHTNSLSALPTSPVLDPSSPTDSCGVVVRGSALSKPTVDELLSPVTTRNQSESRKLDYKLSSGSGGDHTHLSDTRCAGITEPRNSPNEYIWRRLESLVDCMVSENQGIPIRNVKSLMSVIPSIFTGSDIVVWFMENVGADDVTEAVHLASRISAMGYLFSIDEHTMTVKNDSHTYYRFQTPCLYPNRCPEADTVDYAVYLCKRTMQNKHRLELVDFEAERLASLQSLYCHKWEFIYMQAEAEVKVDKKRDKMERIVLESQEAAYWDVHRPAPGCVNTTEVDMRKLCRAKRPKKVCCRSTGFPVPSGPGGVFLFSVLEGLSGNERLVKLNASMHKRIKASKAIENIQNYCDQYADFDLMLCAAVSGANAAAGGIANCGSLGGGMGGLGGGPTGGSSGIITSGSTVPLMLRKTSAALSVTHGTAITLAVAGCVGGQLSSLDKNNENSLDSVQHANPWISENVDYWSADSGLQDLSIRRVKRWSFSFQELLKDPLGRGKFQRWLEKEFAAENLMFWQECQELKSAPLRELPSRIAAIYSHYLSLSATDPVNVDSKVREIVFGKLGLDKNTNQPEHGGCVGAGASHLDRYCFEEAEEQIFQLMKSASYCRFLRSDIYRELFSSTKKKSKKHRGGVSLVVGGGSAGSGGFSAVGAVVND